MYVRVRLLFTSQRLQLIGTGFQMNWPNVTGEGMSFPGGVGGEAGDHVDRLLRRASAIRIHHFTLVAFGRIQSIRYFCDYLYIRCKYLWSFSHAVHDLSRAVRCGLRCRPSWSRGFPLLVPPTRR